MRVVYCDWIECKHCAPEKDFVWGAGRCTKEVIRMYRGQVSSKNKSKDPPTCSWYTEREEK